MWHNNNLNNKNTDKMDVIISNNSCRHMQVIKVTPAQAQAAYHNPPCRHATTTIAPALFNDSQWNCQRLDNKSLDIDTKTIGSVFTEQSMIL